MKPAAPVTSTRRGGPLRVAFTRASKVRVSHWLGCLNYAVCAAYDFPEDSWVAVAKLRPEDTTMSNAYMWCFFKALA